MKKVKVKITKAPVETMAYGGQKNYGLDLGSPYTQYLNPLDYSAGLNKTLQPVDREAANVEAEKSEEVVADFAGNGSMQKLTVGGKRHSEGGTPLNLPENSFIFSDTAKLKMKGSELAAFGKNEKGTKSYTPAELAKQYDLNIYQAILDDPKADSVSKKTAELMIGNYQKKLSQLALVQEAKKGFPQGIPDIAVGYLQTMTNSLPSEEGTEPTMKMGGALKEFARGGEADYDINPYTGGKTKKGTTTPTGKNNAFDRGKDYLKSWEAIIPGISGLSNQEAQSKIYEYTLQNNPEAVRKMWSTYGMTAKGLNDKSLSRFDRSGKFSDEDLSDDNLNALKAAYADGMFGVRQLDPGKDVPAYTTMPKLAHVPVPGVNHREALLTRANPVIPQEAVLTPGDFNPVGNVNPGVFDYMTPDKLSFVAGLRNRAGIKKYTPWEAPVNAYVPEPTFYDPNRELANNNEQMNTQMTYNNQFSGPQGVAARNSNVAGNAATNAANILAKYNNQNVTVANQFEGAQADVMNKLMEAQAARSTRLYDKNTIANQQYDNSVSKAENEILKAGINAWDNRAQLSMVNDTNPYYSVDPRTGRIIFKGGKSVNGTTPGATSSTSFRDLYDQAVAQGMDDEYAKRWAYDQLKGGRATYTDKDMDTVPDMAKYTTSYNGIIGRK